MANIFVSTGCFKTQNLDKILEICVKNGIHNLELSSGIPYAEGLLEVVRVYHKRPLSYLVHNYFPPHKLPFVLNLASTDEVSLRRSLDHCRAAIDLAAELGAPFYSVHAGAAMNARPEDLGRPLAHTISASPEKAYMTFIQSTSYLAANARSKGIKLLIENHVIAPFNLVNGKNTFAFSSTANDILAFLADVGAPNLGILLDVGHLKVTAKSLGFDCYEFVEQIASYIDAFHLSENDELSDQNLAFDRNAWFMAILRIFPRATYIIESYGLDVADIRACQDAILEVLG